MSGRLFLVDGDNHIYEGLKGIDHIRMVDAVQIYLTQKGLYDKLIKKMAKFGDRVRIKIIPSGDQAVDNAIKSRMGSEAKFDRYSEVRIISQDNNYKRQCEKAHKVGKKLYRVASSIEEAIGFSDIPVDEELTFVEMLNRMFCPEYREPTFEEMLNESFKMK